MFGTPLRPQAGRSPASLYSAGLSSFATQNWDAAIEQLLQLQKADPSFFEGCALLAECHLARSSGRDMGAAVQVMQQVLDARGGDLYTRIQVLDEFHQFLGILEYDFAGLKGAQASLRPLLSAYASVAGGIPDAPIPDSEGPGACYDKLVEMLQTAQEDLADLAPQLDRQMLTMRTESGAPDPAIAPFSSAGGFVEFLRERVVGPIHQALYKEYGRQLQDEYNWCRQEGRSFVLDAALRKLDVPDDLSWVERGPNGLTKVERSGSLKNWTPAT